MYVEDDRELCSVLQDQLLSLDYSADCCHTGTMALYFAMSNSYDLILLDRMLPEVDGLSILKTLRQNSIHVPVILTTALGTVTDRVSGLDCGADDYLVKPYDIEELLARIRALSRRPHSFSEEQKLSYRDLDFDQNTRILTKKDFEKNTTAEFETLSKKLSRREADLLEFFLRNPETTLTREQLFSRVWGADGMVEDGNLDTYVYFLRKHLRALKSCVVIVTVHRAGYRMEENHVS